MAHACGGSVDSPRVSGEPLESSPVGQDRVWGASTVLDRVGLGTHGALTVYSNSERPWMPI